MPSKFHIGDKVIINRKNNRTLKELLRGLRLDHPRTIVDIHYDKGTQHTQYYLGDNKRGKYDDMSMFHFRACELKLWVKGKIGHPRAKRGYKSKLESHKGLEA